jgi:hypothetical protein
MGSIVGMALALLSAVFVQPTEAFTTVLRCAVTADREERVYELQKAGAEPRLRWVIAMKSREAGASPVVLPLPDAKPAVTAEQVSLSYHSLNGGRAIEWRATTTGAKLDVHANFELEVNVDADLDRRVDLMNTDGPITNLTCTITP